jgi:hypothetical protein
MKQLRANLVLLSLSACAANAGWLAIAVVLDGPEYSQSPVIRGAALATALLIMLKVRRHAKRAFEAASRGGHIEWSGPQGSTATIADQCPSGWLVQLHLELQATEPPNGRIDPP